MANFSAQRLDLALSFTDSALGDVDLVMGECDGLAVYDYRKWLTAQIGEAITVLAERIYSTTPCIVFATHDWFFRPATLQEQLCLVANSEPKLVIDYVGEFRRRNPMMKIAGVTYCDFQNDQIDLVGVRKFLEQALNPINRA